MNNFQYNKAIAASDILTTIEAILAYSIANYYNWDTQSPAYPSEETLARDCKMSTRSVRRALKGLVNKGYVSYTRQYNKPNLYTPVLPLRTVSPFNEDTSGLLKDNRKDKEKIINKSSSEDLVLSNISIKEGITTTSDNPSLAEVKAIAAEDYWAVFESR
jgi:DNA-binding transcriptional MocR family regulator